MAPPPRQPDLLALISPNGLGHFRRSVGILSRLLERLPELRIHVLCADWQVAATTDWRRSAGFFQDRRVSRTGGVMDPGVTWSVESSAYTDASLGAWLDRCRKVPEMNRAGVVISDNLGTVLAIRPDSVLVGSFLWGDVLAQAHPESAAVQRFAEQETELLARWRPPMLCVADIVMPAVLARTGAVPLGWMCEHEPVPDPGRGRVPRVGVLGGATGAADRLLREIVRSLSASGRFGLAVPAGLGPGVASQHEFRYQPEDFAALDVAVCRPGVGTVTDCIAQGVPMVTVHEGPVNPELAHNGRRLAELGLAVDLGADPDPAGVVTSVERVAGAGDRMRPAIAGRRRQGLGEAVEFLARRLEVG